MGRCSQPRQGRGSPARPRRPSCCAPRGRRRPRAISIRLPTSMRRPPTAVGSLPCSRAARWRARSNVQRRRKQLTPGASPGIEEPMKIYDLSQPLNQDCSFWPFYPPFEVKYIKRKAEHGVNAQYIMTSNHMGTHLDAPRHFVSNGKTIDEIPIEWCYGPGMIVDLSDMLGELDVFGPQDIEKRAEVHDGDILFIHTGWHRYSFLSPDADEEKYIQRHPGPHYSICDWLLKKKIHIWGVDM